MVELIIASREEWGRETGGDGERSCDVQAARTELLPVVRVLVRLYFLAQRCRQEGLCVFGGIFDLVKVMIMQAETSVNFERLGQAARNGESS